MHHCSAQFSISWHSWYIHLYPLHVSCRTYNIQGISFTPAELVEEMRKYFPNMKVTYEPDERQAIGMFSSSVRVHVRTLPLRLVVCQFCVPPTILTESLNPHRTHTQLTLGQRCWTTLTLVPTGTGPMTTTSQKWLKRSWRNLANQLKTLQ